MSFSSSLHPRQSFHTTYSTTVAAERPSSECKLFIAHELPPAVFADKYELALYESYTSTVYGESNLELPASAVSSDGSWLLLEVLRPTFNITIDVPLHLRYGEPSNEGGHHEVAIPRPIVFWACHNPVDMHEDVNLPEALLSNFDGPMSFFAGLPSSEGTNATETVRVPVGSTRDLEFTQIVTALVITCCFIYMAYASLSTASRLRLRRAPRKTE